MLKVFICENNKNDLKTIEEIVTNTIFIENYDMAIELSCRNPHYLLDYISSSNSMGLYFIAIDYNSDINGFEVATSIRKVDPRGFIVFITSHAEMSYLTFHYKIEAMDYILKDNFNDSVKLRISGCIKNALEKYSCRSSNSSKIFSFSHKDKIINIDFDDILFFETSPTIHKVILHSINKKLEFYSKMKDIENSLDDRFFRCHNSFIINTEKIKEIDKKNRIAYMINNSKCIISTRSLNNLISNINRKVPINSE